MESVNFCVTNEETTCIICSLDLPPLSSSVTSSWGEDVCFSCLLHAWIGKHQDEHQEPAIQDAIQDSAEPRHEEDLVDVESADDVEVLVQKELSETRREQIKQLQQLEDNMEQLKTTLVLALGLESREDRAWVEEAIAKERLEMRREMAWLERRTWGGL